MLPLRYFHLTWIGCDCDRWCASNLPSLFLFSESFSSNRFYLMVQHNQVMAEADRRSASSRFLAHTRENGVAPVLEISRYLTSFLLPSITTCAGGLTTLYLRFFWETNRFTYILHCTRTWEGQLPGLSDQLDDVKIDWLLVQDVFNETDTTGVPLIDFIIRSGYKDKFEVVEGTEPVLRRTTAVHRAARSSRSSIYNNIPKLFEIYDFVNYIDDFDFTHFHIACTFGCKEVVEKFLQLGQDVHCLAQKSVDPPLHLALENEHKEVVELLLKSGADPNLANKDGLTPLHTVCSTNDDYHLANRETLAELLLNYEADPNLANKDGSSPLHVICNKHGNSNLAKILLKTTDGQSKKVQVNAVDNFGRTPLQIAVANLLPDMVDVLLDYGACVGFVFPTENYFAEKYTLKCTLQAIVFPTMRIVESLERKGYKMEQNAALTIMNSFAKNGLIDESADIDECLRSDEDFASIAKRQLVGSNLSLFDFLQLPHEEAEKVFTCVHYDEFTSKISHLRSESHKAYIKYLCETVTRGFFRDWALKLFVQKNPWLPKRFYEIFIRPLKIKDLWDICMAATNKSTQWLAAVRTDNFDIMFKNYKKCISSST
ncbi:unnamed protein product [Trichogramma brassicae]|uniref:Uncharacterized protein n=1 Tax=Trichogramma brassicae TaxID=86971 RepID=A0A6H5IP71_9HYME|nr:unnamed protein product [Trichogramma brassicae]